MATQRSIVDVLLLRRLLVLCVATTFALSWRTCSTPPPNSYPSPSSPSSNVRFYWYDHSEEQLVASAIPRPPRRSRHIINKRPAEALHVCTDRSSQNMWAYPHLEYYHNHRPPIDLLTGSRRETYSGGSRKFKLCRAIMLFADTPS